jgi:hypothetical protein
MRDSRDVTGVLLGILSVLILVATAFVLGLALRITGRARFLVAVYVLSCTELVALFLFLSAFDVLSRGTIFAALVTVLVAATAALLLVGVPKSAHRHWARNVAIGPPVLLCLAAVVVLSATYVFALIVGTAPNGWDPLNYHLSRAAFWVQSEHIGYIAHAYDQRLNFNPPNAEILVASALALTRNERSVGFIQFVAWLSCGVGIAALARRIGTTTLEAACGALLFMLTPIALLQSSDAKNDLVVASFLVAAAVFTFGKTRSELLLAALATALAVGAKFTAAYGLVVLVVLALVAAPRSARAWRLLALGAGTVAGSYWYVVNLHVTGRFLGDQSGTGTLTAPLDPKPNLVTSYGDALDTLDLSGARGKDIVIYAVVAVIVAAALAFMGTRRWAAAAGVVVAVPLLMLPLSEAGRSGLVRLYDALGKPPAYLAIGDATASSATTASDTASWFGPTGLLLVLATAAAVTALARLGAFARSALVLVYAPVAWLVLVALTLTYHPWQGRFFIFPLALSAALWGLVLRTRAIAWAVVTLASITALLSLVHFVEKPSGLRLLENTGEHSVWRMTRWEVQSQHDPPLAPVYRFFDEQVQAHDSVALALGPNEFAFPFFGPHLTHRIDLVPSGSDARAVMTRWLFADPGRSEEVDKACWQPVLTDERGTVFRRLSGCA